MFYYKEICISQIARFRMMLGLCSFQHVARKRGPKMDWLMASQEGCICGHCLGKNKAPSSEHV
uniref:Uncharacterized protein n=2 Tax=Kalanchoe fedtschenkoi TaxID=63787 RepID=A0A7N0ZTP2_KALFE